MDQPTSRRPRLAFLLLRTLDHFAQELIAGLPAVAGWDVRGFLVGSAADIRNALAWTDRPDLDAVWFEFCWPPFPKIIADTPFGGRRVIVRVHRIEAVETDFVAQTAWQKVDDVIVVSRDMAARVRQAAPALDTTTRLHIIHNGLDLQQFAPLRQWDRFRIGWCGLMTLRKNPTLALQVLSSLHALDPRYHLHICGQGGERLAIDSFFHLARRLDLMNAVHLAGKLPRAAMPAWHADNGILLHTSLHESFGYAIAEAAAAGCDIAVLDHAGADEFWPDATRYGTVGEAVALIGKSRPHRWREHVARHFSLDEQLGRTAAMLCAPLAGQRPGVA